MKLAQPQDIAEIGAALGDIVGVEHFVQDPDECRYFAQDVFNEVIPVWGVLRPGTAEELSRALALTADSDLVVVPRGGGYSYTDGYLANHAKTLLVDLRRLKHIVDINAEDRYVTVESGCTWQDLKTALDKVGLRTPYWGPLSGLKSTVGGAMSQNSVFFGSGQYGTAVQSLIGLEVVLADGNVITTGSASDTANAFFRYYGPDLTGLFAADCGALGFKTKVTLRLIDPAPQMQGLSFGFQSPDSLLCAMIAVGKKAVVAESFALDPVLQEVRIQRASLAEDVKTLGKVVKSKSSLLEGVKAGARLVMAGRDFLSESPYSLHLTVEGRDKLDLQSKINVVRAAIGDYGKEIENSIPNVMRSHPFGPLNNMIGPMGERWVPVHGIVPFSQAKSAYDAIEALFSSHCKQMEQENIRSAYLLTLVENAGVLIEPVFFWQDSLMEFHHRNVDDDVLARIHDYSENLAARALVAELKEKIAEIIRLNGGVHFQIGRFYPYRQNHDSSTWDLLMKIKNVVDPRGRMNPGVLGF